MKIVSLLIILSANLCLAQSFPYSTYPKYQDRPAFKLIEHFDDDSEYPQKDLLKSYLPLYLHKKLQRLTAMQALKFDYFRRANFSKKDFDIFKIFKNKRSPKIENDLSFENDEIDFSNLLVSDLGVCMGVTSVIRKFNMLAHFDPKNKLGTKYPIRQIDEKAWFAYFQKLIDRVMANIPTVFPEFENLEELSMYGNFYTYLQRHSLDQWALNNLSLRAGVGEMLLSIKNHFSRRKARTLYSQLYQRLKRHYNPKVYLSKPGSFKQSGDIWIHVMQVYKISNVNKDGSYRIHLWDPNYPASHELSDAIVDITADGKAIFHDEDNKKSQLSMIDLYRWDDAEIAEILINYKHFCSQEKHQDFCKY